MNFVLAFVPACLGKFRDRRTGEDMHGGCHSLQIEVWSKQPTEEERITEKFRVALTEGDNYR
jgi:galactose mutarotase-like enzyme